MATPVFIETYPGEENTEIRIFARDDARWSAQAALAEIERLAQ